MTISSFPDYLQASETLSVLREEGSYCAKLKLGDYDITKDSHPLLFELSARLNRRAGPHLVIDAIWFSQYYGGISRVWNSILNTFNISDLFPISSPLTFVQRHPCDGFLDNFNVISATQKSPFDYSSYHDIIAENNRILSSVKSPVFCSTWITSASFQSCFPHLAVVHDLIPEFLHHTDSQYKHFRNLWLSSAHSILSVSSSTSNHLSTLYPSALNVQWCHPPLPTFLLNLSSDLYYDRLWTDLSNRLGSAKGYFYLPSSSPRNL